MVQKEGVRWVRGDSKFPRQTRICKHHGETEFYFATDNRNKGQGGSYKCLQCQREKNKRHKAGIKIKPDPSCSNFVGIYIAEQVLQKAFSVMKKALPMEHWDFVCGQGFTIDSKCSTLRLSGSRGHKSLGWQFHISKNKYPQYFCLIALDNTPEDVAKDPKPIYVWLVPGDALISGKLLNERVSLTISPKTINKLAAYRRTDMEGKIIKCCSKLKDLCVS